MANNQIQVTQVWDRNDFQMIDGSMDNAKSTLSYTYVVRNCANEAEACRAAWDAAPDFWREDPTMRTGGIPKVRVSIEERCGETTWKAKVDYEHISGTGISSGDDGDESSDAANGSKEVTFEASLESITVMHAVSQRLAYVAQNAPPIYDVSAIPIGWNGKVGPDSDATGVTVEPSGLREEYRRRLDYKTVRSGNWRRRIADCRGFINIGKFKNWAPGEALFLGASYQTPQKGAKYVDVTFSFSIRRNEAAATLAGHPLGLVRGWDYVWSVYEDASLQVSDYYHFARNIRYIFVSQVCNFADFGKLGL